MNFDLQLFGMSGGETTTERSIPDQTETEKQLEALLSNAAINRLDFSNNQMFNDFRSTLGNVVDNIDWAGLMNQVNDTNMNQAADYKNTAEQIGRYLERHADATNGVYGDEMKKAVAQNAQAVRSYADAQAANDDEYKTGINEALRKYESALAAADSEYRTNQGKNLSDYTNTMRGYLNGYESKMNNALGKYQSDMGGVNSRWEDLTNGILPDSFATHRQAALNADMEGTVGNSFNNLANRGIINSAVTNKAMDDISQNASDTLAKMWSSDMALEADLLRNRQSGIQGVYDTTANNANSIFQNQSNTENQRYNNATNYYGTLLNNANTNANTIYGNTSNALGTIHQNQAATATNNWNAANTNYQNTADAWNTWYNGRNQQLNTQANAYQNMAQNNYNNYTNAAQNTMNNALSAQTSSFAIPTQYNSYMDSSYTPASNLYNTMYSGRMGTGSTTTSQDDGGAGLWGAVGSIGAATIACFTGNTLVSTPSGYKYIRDIRVGDDVLSMQDGEIVIKKVATITEPQEKFIIDVTFNNGTVWHTTSFQRLFDGRHFHSLAVGRTALNNDLLPRAIVNVEYTQEKALVYDLAVEGFAGENVFFANDIAAEGIGE